MNDTKNNLDWLLYRVDAPYPELDIPQKSFLEARALLTDYGGKESETTAIMQYAYQSYILKEKYPELAGVLEGIAVTEMYHHELLGEAIVALGGTPIIGSAFGYWRGDFVNYAKPPKEILRLDIRGEKQAVENYRKTLSVIKNKSVRALLERIILDEERHIEILTELLESL